MNAPLKTVVASGLASILLSGLLCAQDPDSKPDPELAAYYETRGGKASPAISEKLAALRKRIKDEKLSFTVGYTDPMDRSLEQLCGTLPTPPRSVQAPLDRVGPPAADEQGVQQVALVSSFDWRSLGKVTPVRDQGACGDCWAFGTIAMLESSYLIVEKKSYDLSEQNVLSCTGSNDTCAGGTTYDAVNYITQHGITSEKEYPYTATDSACQNIGASYRIADSGYVGSSDMPSVQQIKDALKAKGPLAVAVYADDAFQAYTGGIFDERKTHEINHTVTIVGWWDIAGTTIWVIKNSWGKHWGLSGYMLIVQGSNQIGKFAMWAKEKPKDSGWPAGTPRPGVSPTPTPSSYPAGSPRPGVSPTPTPSR
jgi:cathepsin L